MPHDLWITLLGPQFHFLVTLPVVFPQTVTPCAPLWTAIWLTGRLGLQPHNIPLALFPRGSFLFISTVVFSLTGSGMSPGLLSEQCAITVTRVRMLWMCLRKAKTTCFRVGCGLLYKSWVFCSKISSAGMSVSLFPAQVSTLSVFAIGLSTKAKTLERYATRPKTNTLSTLPKGTRAAWVAAATCDSLEWAYLYSKQLDLEKVRICKSIEHLISRVWSVGCDFPFEIAKLYSLQAYDWNANQGKKAGLPESRVSMFTTLAPEFKSYNSDSVCVDSHLASHPCDGHVNGKVPEHFFSQKNWDEAAWDGTQSRWTKRSQVRDKFVFKLQIASVFRLMKSLKRLPSWRGSLAAAVWAEWRCWYEKFKVIAC